MGKRKASNQEENDNSAHEHKQIRKSERLALREKNKKLSSS